MNLATRRLSTAELASWGGAAGHSVLAFRVADRFGDSGLTGIVGLRCDGAEAHLVDFLLSCRVMGRSVEEAMLHVAVGHCRARGASTLRATFKPTPRNAPLHAFLQRSSLGMPTDNVFTWDTSQPFVCPRWITVTD